MECHLIWCNVLRSAGSDFCGTDNFPDTVGFCGTDNFQDTFVNFHFMMLTQAWMKEEARILNHVRKILFQNAVANHCEKSVQMRSFFWSKKIKINTRNNMTSSYHSNVRPNQNKSVPFFYYLDWIIGFNIYPCLDKV